MTTSLGMIFAKGRKLRSLLLGKLYRIAPRKVSYKGFAIQSAAGLESFVTKRLNYEPKIKCLEWMGSDPQLEGRFSVLDVGCGPGVVGQMVIRDANLKDRLDYHGVDQSDNAIEHCRRTLPEHFKFIKRDVLKDGLPPGHFDVIMINEVLEHLPDYKTLIAAAIDKSPKVLVITTFAVLPERRTDRRLWRPDYGCYMNSYAYQPFLQFLRGLVKSPVLTCDFGSRAIDRDWFPLKANIAWYTHVGAGTSC